MNRMHAVLERLVRVRLLPPLLLWTALLAPPLAQAYQVIVHPGTSARVMDRSRLQSIFGLRMDKWPNNQPIKVFVLADDAPLHREFVKTVLGIYPYQLRQSWDRLIYAGFAQAPYRVENEQEMLQRVGETPGAIGYVRGPVSGDRVNVLTIQERN